MIPVLLLAQAVVQMPAPGIAQAVPPTAWHCNLAAADGTKFDVRGITPEFPVGSDPNASKFVTVASSHADAFKRAVGVSPGHASDWFREFQVSSTGAGNARYTLNLMLRREGASIAHVTRYVSTGKPIPYEYYAVGLCKADFAPSARRQERG